MNKQLTHSIILFDGVCNLCNGAVNFVIKRDSGNVFKFASLQEKQGTLLLKKHAIDARKLDSYVVHNFQMTYHHTFKKHKNIEFVLDRPYMLDDLFHSLADLLGISAREVDLQRSIFSSNFKSRKRIVTVY